MKRLLVLLILFLLYSCATELTIKEIENKIPGLFNLSIIKDYEYEYFTKNDQYISSILFDHEANEIRKLIFYNLKTQKVKEITVVKKIFHEDDWYNFMKVDLINNNRYIIESINFSAKQEKQEIKYIKIENGLLLQQKEFFLKKSFDDIWRSNIDRHKFLISYPKSFTDYSLLNFENDDLNQTDINLSLYDKNGYRNSKFVFLGPYDKELVVLVFNDKDQKILSFYDIEKDKIKKEIVLNCQKISSGIGIVFAECSPSSDYLYLMALKYYHFLFDLNTYELIKLPHRNLNGIERFYPLDWSSDSKYLLLNINKESFVLDIDAYRASGPETYKLNSEYFWELEYKKNN